MIQYRLGAPTAPVLERFMGCRARNSYIMGPLGSGKTIGVVQRLLAQMAEQPPNAQGIRPTRWMAIRNTYPSLMGTTVKDFLQVFEGLGRMTMGGLNPPTFTADFKLEDGSRVQSETVFLALDRDDAIQKLRGYQITGAWFNEAKELSKAIIDMADLRHGRFPTEAGNGVACGWHGCLGDTNAPDVDHWYWRLAEHDKPEGWEFFRQPGGVLRKRDANGEPIEGWVVNPHAENMPNLPDGYYEAGMAGKDDDWIAVMLSNEYGFVVEGAPVHPWYVDSVHCSRHELEPDPNLPLIIGVDFGRTPAAVLTQLEPGMGRRTVLDEFTSEDMSAAIFAPELKRYIEERYPHMPIEMYCDPAGEARGQATEDTPIAVLRANGFPARPCESNSPLLRRAALSNPGRRLCMDGKPAFVLSPRAKITRRGLQGGFCYRKLKMSGPERYAEGVDKNMYSHPCFVAGTPISTPSGPVPVHRLIVGDMVNTPLGPRPVVSAFHREAEVLHVEQGIGRLTTTPDHPFMTPHGYVHAEALGYGRVVTERCPQWIQSALLRFAQRQSTRSSSSMGCGTTADRPVTTSATTVAATDTYIARCGAWLTARFQPITTSITSMGTAATTGWATSNAFPAATTFLTTRASQPLGPTHGERLPKPRWQRWSGGARTRKRHGESESKAGWAWWRGGPETSRSLRPASTAEPATRLRQSTQAEASSARSVVSRLLGELLAWTMRSAAVRSVVMRFASVATAGAATARVRAGRSRARAVVYNIEVAEAHCYYAGGVLVSNCEALEYALMGSGEGRAALRPARSQGEFHNTALG